MAITIAESLIEEGFAKGAAQTQLLSARQYLRRVLEKKFGPLPEELSQRIEATTELQRLLDAFDQALEIDRVEALRL